MNRFIPLPRILFLGWLVAALSLPLVAAGPRQVLGQHSLQPGAQTSPQETAKVAPVAGSAKATINCDGLHSLAKDRELMSRFKDELARYGITAVVSPYCSRPNNHVLTVKNCPKDHWIVYAVGGLCAGTMVDMVQGRGGYLKASWKDHQIRGMIFLNLSSNLLRSIPFLRRAWDDNFMPKSFTGLANPYQYLTSAGFPVAETADSPTPVLNTKRVPELAKQVAAIILGKAVPGATGASGSSGAASANVLRRVPQSDTSQDKARVRELQKALQACGYYRNFLIDGWFGPYTQMAVMEFQRARGLPVNGEVDAGLFEAIRKGNQTAGSGSSEAVPAGLQGFLQPTRNAQSTNAKIQAKAASLRGASTAETVNRIFSFVKGLTYKSYYNSRVGATGMLSSGAGNCCDHANLLVALLRASGIPARYAHSTDCIFRSGLRVGHVWAQVYLNGRWQDLDATGSSNGVGSLKSFRAVAAVKTYRELSF